MLTEKALHDRMWGWIPTLGQILSEKQIPDRYFGYSSVSDNSFDRITRLMKITILIQENLEEIKKRLPSNINLREDLNNVAWALEGTAREMQEQSKQLHGIIHSY